MRLLGLLIFAKFIFGICLAGELPPQFLTPTSYSELFRASLKAKIAQMDQNFIRTAAGKEVYFYDTKNVVCQDGFKASAGAKLFKIKYSTSLKEGRYDENRFYYGCDNTLNFRETYRLDGAKAQVHRASDIFAGNMDFNPASEAKSFYYELADGKGESFFAISLTREEGVSNAVFYFQGQKIFRQQIINEQEKTYVRYFAYPYRFEISSPGMNYSARSDGAFKNYVLAVMSGENIFYYNEKKDRISMAAFQKLFQLHGFNSIMESMFLNGLPKTKFVTNNLQGSKMLEELRNAQTFLISGTQLNLVRNLIEEYIKAVQEGSIVDRRR